MPQRLNKWRIDSIFEKNNQRNHTNDALLCQDILLYFGVINKTVLDNNSFVLRELQKWMVQNNKEIREYYQGSDSHTSVSNRIHAKEPRINNRFEDLLQLRLIKRGETMTKNIQPTKSPYIDRKTTYEYTREGIFLGLIIKSMNLKKVIITAKAEHGIIKDQKELEKIYQDIYDILGLLFRANENSSANTVFYSNLFKKCKDKGVFNQFVELVHNIINTDNNIIDFRDLFERIVNLAFYSKQSQTEFLKVLYETVEALDKEVKKLVLYNMKLFAERQYENKQQDSTRQYEQFRFDLRRDYERIAVQGYCENCKNKQNLALHYSDLISPTANDGIRVKCPSCNCSLMYDQD